MKIRSDFVSNSSSSSFIVATAKPQQELFDFIVKNTYDDTSSYWGNEINQANMEFLKEHFNQYFQLVIGDFELFTERGPAEWMEESEEDAEECRSLCNCIVPIDDIEKFIKDGKVQANSYKDFLEKGKYPTRYFMSYHVFEITQDSIDFTRWLLKQCVSVKTSPELKAYVDFVKENKLIEKRNRGEDIPKNLIVKAEELRAKCFGIMIAPSYSEYVEKDGKYIRERHQLSELLDKYEKYLKEGKSIYRFCVGYSGEGTDYDSYIWVDKCNFAKADKNDFIFESDPWW